MGTEKFIAFKEDGTAYRLKGRILRFLDNEPVSEDDKTNIRSTLSVPASGEGLTPANNLSDLDSAATARTNLSVNSIDEDAQANALKVTAPALYFNGSSSVVTVADDDKLTFSSLTEFGTTTAGTWSPEDNTPALTDGTGTLNDHYKIDADGTVVQGGSTLSIINGTSVTAGQVVYYDGSVWRVKDCDDLPFTVSAWVKPEFPSATLFALVSKYGTSAPVREWFIDIDSNKKLRLAIVDTSGNSTDLISDTALTSYEGQWIHVAATYNGAGPNSANAFTANMSGATLYVNGALVAATATNNASYAGMSDTSQAVWIGRLSNSYAKGHIKDVQIVNRSLTASEVAELARGNDLGFAEEWGGAHGGVYTQDATPSGEWTSVAGTDADEAGPIGGVADVLKFTVNNTTGSHYMSRTMFAVGKRYRVSGSIYVPTQSNADGVWFLNGGSTIISQQTAPTLDSWASFSAEFLAKDTTLRIYATDGGSTNFTDSGGDDVIYVNGLTVTEIGTLAEFRAERYDTSTSKLYDISDNAFVGTGTSVSLTGREVPVYETGTWTPTITFGGGSTGITYSVQEGNYTRIGDTVFITGFFELTSTGSDSGIADIAGLPFTSKNLAVGHQGFQVGIAGLMAGLTSPITGIFLDNSTSIRLYDWGAAGTASLNEGNFTASSSLRFSGTYHIQ